MYEAYYHLKGSPFRLSPDPRFLYSSKVHSRAMAYLVYGVAQAEGFIVITGEIGAGKTTLARALANNLAEEDVVLAHVVSTRLEGDDIVRMVGAAFGLPHHDSKAVVLSSAVTCVGSRQLGVSTSASATSKIGAVRAARTRAI